MDGIIKFYDRSKGYGFINPLNIDNDSRDIFFHRSDVSNNFVFFKKDDHVIFDLIEDDRGLHAIKVIKY